MIKSMTGFGKSLYETNDKTIQIEIKTLNSKHFDAHIKLPNQFKEKELELRKYLQEHLTRGKIDMHASYESESNKAAYQLDQALIRKYHDQLKQVAETIASPPPADPLSLIVQFPDIIKQEPSGYDESAWQDILHATENAVKEVIAFRNQEGVSLHKELSLHIGYILQHGDQISANQGERIEKIKQRIRNSFQEMAEPNLMDKERFEQEIVYYLEKLDISEELSRLKNHCQYFMQTMNHEETSGKKLIFISQEIGREINTIGSKANDAGIQVMVVQMKDALEKIKEQLLNVV